MDNAIMAERYLWGMIQGTFGLHPIGNGYQVLGRVSTTNNFPTMYCVQPFICRYWYALQTENVNVWR